MSLLIIFYMSIDALRLLRGKQKQDYLKKTVPRSIFINWLLLSLIWGVSLLNLEVNISDLAYVLSMASVVVAIVLFFTIVE